jgi:hypothetical protein
LLQRGVHQRKIVGLYAGGPEHTSTSGVGSAAVVGGIAVVVVVVAGNVVVVVVEFD